MRYAETPFGFTFGAMDVQRAITQPKLGTEGWVALDVKTPRDGVTVYASRTGKLRVFDINGAEWTRKAKKGGAK